MNNQRCLANISKQPPPDNRPCTDAWCAEMQDQIDVQCQTLGRPADTPILSKDPNLFGPERPGFCYCCCCRSAGCLDNIRKERPPDNVPCRREWCQQIAGSIDRYCRDMGYLPDDPIPAYDPDLRGPGKGGSCYCCCGALPQASLAVESSPGAYLLLPDVEEGTTVLAAGPGLDWQPRPVLQAFPEAVPLDSARWIRAAFPEEESGLRDLVVAPDHLFLMDNGRLRAARHLAPGGRLRRADGGTAEVLLAVEGSYHGALPILRVGEPDAHDLSGRLLNLNGVVCADYGVQVSYVTGHLAAGLTEEAAAPGAAPRGGSAPLPPREEWPNGFLPAGHEEN